MRPTMADLLFEQTGLQAHRSEAVERALQTCGTHMRWRTAVLPQRD